MKSLRKVVVAYVAAEESCCCFVLMKRSSLSWGLCSCQLHHSILPVHFSDEVVGTLGAIHSLGMTS